MFLNFLSHKKTISTKEALSIIDGEQLFPYLNTWHYTYHLDIFFNKCIRYSRSNRHYIHPIKPINEWAPIPLYTNVREFDFAPSDNARPFWFLRLTTLNDFLERRTRASSKPKKHFPTTLTYTKLINKISPSLQIAPLDQAFFTEHYDCLKRPEHKNAKELLTIFGKANRRVPQSWLKTASLYEDGRVTAIGFIVDDGKSASLFNLASVLGDNSYGILLCVEVIRHYSENWYFSFDAGISSRYGVYKDKIFIDSIPILDVLIENEILYK